MMKKRQIAIIPLLIASIVMLMSTVIPHHHHGKLICFTYSHCEKEQIAKTCEHNHEHDSNPSDNTCKIQQLFQTNIIKQHNSECQCCPEITPDHLFIPLLAILGLDNSLLLIGQDKEILPPIYMERLHTITWSTNYAGRAPPTVIA